jgi:DNA primase
MIPDEIIEQVRDAADLISIVGEKVSLKRTGADYRGPCPFHGGKGRNFAVIPKKGLYYCFVCHEGGDVFTWFKKQFGLDYPTAVREVARRVGIIIPESGPRPGPDPREPLFGAVAVAQEWFARQLQDSGEGDVARQYLASRQITLEQAGELGLGYAPRGGAFLEEARKLGIEVPILLEAGLANQREDGSVAARFRGRLLFPIHDLRGRVVGFGGRLLGAGEPKYLNSPETPVFHKGSQLYHLHLAKGAIRREETVIIVEGYFDVVRLTLAGIEHVVAPMGTALTEGQAQTLRRFAKTAILLYDSDRAGLRATFRNGDELLRHGLRVKVASLPPGEDPDTLVQKGGAAALQPLLRDAMDLLERKLMVLEQHGWFADVARRRDALDRILPTLRAASDAMARDLYIGRVAEKVGVSRETLEKELRERPAPSPAPPSSAVLAHPRPSSSRPPQRFGGRMERSLLRVLVASPAWRTRAASDFTPDDFEIPAHRAIFDALIRLPETADASEIVSELPDDVVPVFDRLRESAAAQAGINLDQEYVGAAQSLHDRPEFRRVYRIQDLTERSRIVKEWGKEKQMRWQLELARLSARRARRG